MIRYLLKERERSPVEPPTVWTSTEVYEARDAAQIKQAILAGHRMNVERWAETESGAYLVGLDRKGQWQTSRPLLRTCDGCGRNEAEEGETICAPCRVPRNRNLKRFAVK